MLQNSYFVTHFSHNRDAFHNAQNFSTLPCVCPNNSDNSTLKWSNTHTQRGRPTCAYLSPPSREESAFRPRTRLKFSFLFRTILRQAFSTVLLTQTARSKKWMKSMFYAGGQFSEEEKNAISPECGKDRKKKLSSKNNRNMKKKNK
ncbi:hypothetical protein CDAR_613451 [Caerostris darwini]|uniref:Uncharacterized protein n=1 Tax=Caerostris darwini TaxID=1538125 RepID=A0AAV4UMK3_9ARAC|nr:hypothetical protein CDAR_613451 [Caerostris darwini]